MDGHHVYQTPEGEDTEWDIIQRRLGNYAPKEPKWTPDAFQPEAERPLKDKEFIKNQAQEELEDLEDDFADDQFLEKYREKRLKEMREKSGTVQFGSVLSIGRADFVGEVTNAGDQVKVVVLLYTKMQERSRKLLRCMEELAAQFVGTKFVKIIATECIEGYPDQNVPTVLLYENSSCKHTLVGPWHFGGDAMTPETVARGLEHYGAIVERKDNQKDQHSLPPGSEDEDSDF